MTLSLSLKVLVGMYSLRQDVGVWMLLQAPFLVLGKFLQQVYPENNKEMWSDEIWQKGIEPVQTLLPQ